MIKSPLLLRNFEKAMLLAEFQRTTPADRLRQCAMLHACACAMTISRHMPAVADAANPTSPHLRHLCELTARLHPSRKMPPR